ncbi:hypothetical protein GCK72_000537 [Caenorhabditis remanei]|uniref:Uncharacterized protein n=1 Tax=Caenorhabditis remanei TaxID=31234 RepID=A0A6A5HQ41_CAERE|nr:hypothetical protein GCK72_000537 [Caenorhabditis remanei]KAF1768724.1 hypothetical protein GCK72_000537 [Caenorhabditis remanei]
MIPVVGTLHVSSNQCTIPVQKYNTYNVSVSVKKPDFEYLRLLERTTALFSVFELLATVAVIALAWNPFCVLFIFPFILRIAALPRHFFVFHSNPIFVHFHASSIAAECLIAFCCTFFSCQNLTWNEDKGFCTVALSSLTVLLFTRFWLTIRQYDHYNRARMTLILSDKKNLFTIV